MSKFRNYSSVCVLVSSVATNRDNKAKTITVVIIVLSKYIKVVVVV